MQVSIQECCDDVHMFQFDVVTAGESKNSWDGCETNYWCKCFVVVDAVDFSTSHSDETNFWCTILHSEHILAGKHMHAGLAFNQRPSVISCDAVVLSVNSGLLEFYVLGRDRDSV